MTRSIASLECHGMTGNYGSAGSRAKYAGFVTNVSSFSNDGKIAVTTGAGHKIVPSQPGVYRVTFSGAWVSATTGKAVKIDISKGTTAVNGTLRTWSSLTGQLQHTFVTEAVLVLDKDEEISIYLDGDADANNSYFADAWLTVERVDI